MSISRGRGVEPFPLLLSSEKKSGGCEVFKGDWCKHHKQRGFLFLFHLANQLENLSSLPFGTVFKAENLHSWLFVPQFVI